MYVFDPRSLGSETLLCMREFLPSILLITGTGGRVIYSYVVYQMGSLSETLGLKMLRVSASLHLLIYVINTSTVEFGH